MPLKSSKLKTFQNFRQNPFAALEAIESTKATMEMIVKKTAEEAAEKAAEKAVREAENRLKTDVVAELKRFIISEGDRRLNEALKGDKGEPGQDSDPYQIAQIVLSSIEFPKNGTDGITPIPGIDYPDQTQIKKMLDEMIGIETNKFTVKNMKMILLEVKKQFPKIEIKGNAIARELEKLAGNERLDYLALKNRPVIGKKGGGGGGGDLFTVEDISSQADGSTKSFTVNKSYKAWFVFASDDLPHMLFENSDGFSLDGARTTLTLNPTNAPQKGSKLFYVYT